jgi:serine O-acetyltransferase
VQGLFKECLQSCPSFRRSLRRDILAVRERDPACESYVDPLLYFKGFQALQAHRVAHWLYGRGRIGLACYLQSRVSQEFQIDIHPAAVIGEGVFIDHGTGIVIGETTQIGDDCSILHQVTLGGSGLMHETRRHPKVGRSVLIGAGACLLGGILVGDGVQIGACSLVLEDIPEHTVAVGVPAKVRGYLKGRSPAEDMQQDMSDLFVEVWKGMDI